MQKALYSINMKIEPPKVVIIGRANVGKSTLFNKFIEEQKSLVSDIPGTTRDRYESDCIWRGQVIKLIDTGGVNTDQNNNINEQITHQASKAIKEADLILFLVDAQTGPQLEDLKIAKKISNIKQPIILVANKADNMQIRESLDSKEWHKFPLGRPQPMSARRGIGTGDI